MSNEKEGRIDIDDLPQAEQELTPEEAKEVQGGLNGNLQIADLTGVAIDPGALGGHNTGALRNVSGNNSSTQSADDTIKTP
jgi:hypothetical protein